MNESTPSETLILEALFQLHDEAFVRGAYEAILGRTPDPGGLDNYLAQVRAGILKAHIVAELADSPEGRIKAVELPGLRSAIAAYRKRAPTLLTRLFRKLASASIEPAERQLRAIDNRLYRIEQYLLRQSRQLDDLLAQKAPRFANASPGAAEKDDFADAPRPSDISPNVGRIFSELKAAIAMKLFK